MAKNRLPQMANLRASAIAMQCSRDPVFTILIKTKNKNAAVPRSCYLETNLSMTHI